jgi:hypothetical protein
MPEPLLPFTVAEVVLTSLEALLSAARLHLGEAMADGRRLDQTDPQEAWRALLAASALVSHTGALMAPEALAPRQAELERLLALLAERHPSAQFAVPAHLLPSR